MSLQLRTFNFYTISTSSKSSWCKSSGVQSLRARGLLPAKHGLLWGTVACWFKLLGFPGSFWPPLLKVYVMTSKQLEVGND